MPEDQHEGSYNDISMTIHLESIISAYQSESKLLQSSVQ